MVIKSCVCYMTKRSRKENMDAEKSCFWQYNVITVGVRWSHFGYLLSRKPWEIARYQLLSKTLWAIFVAIITFVQTCTFSGTNWGKQECFIYLFIFMTVGSGAGVTKVVPTGTRQPLRTTWVAHSSTTCWPVSKMISVGYYYIFIQPCWVTVCIYWED